jgi:hypothetical protein
MTVYELFGISSLLSAGIAVVLLARLVRKSR